jgi:hypothetical protein
MVDSISNTPNLRELGTAQNRPQVSLFLPRPRSATRIALPVNGTNALGARITHWRRPFARDIIDDDQVSATQSRKPEICSVFSQPADIAL